MKNFLKIYLFFQRLFCGVLLFQFHFLSNLPAKCSNHSSCRPCAMSANPDRNTAILSKSPPKRRSRTQAVKIVGMKTGVPTLLPFLLGQHGNYIHKSGCRSLFHHYHHPQPRKDLLFSFGRGKCWRHRGFSCIGDLHLRSCRCIGFERALSF